MTDIAQGQYTMEATGRVTPSEVSARWSEAQIVAGENWAILAALHAEHDRNHYEAYYKRLLDLTVAVPVSLVAGPVVALAALLIKMDSPGPVLFKQERIGRNLEAFSILKLRTMRHGNTHTGQVRSTSPDITKVGRLLRRLKIDELPQIFNVLRGDMSLVGPRPCLPATAASVDRNGLHRFLVKPGLTGLAQVKGNAALSWSQRWEYDREYTEYLSLSRDLKILARTLLVLACGEERMATSND